MKFTSGNEVCVCGAVCGAMPKSRDQYDYTGFNSTSVSHDHEKSCKSQLDLKSCTLLAPYLAFCTMLTAD